MINITSEMKKKYNVSQVADYDGSIKLVLTLKKRTCKCCGKEFQVNGGEFLLWTNKDTHNVSGWFCRRHYVQAKKLINLVK
tara:strand:- start:888 stop:1130 length:243 start_codon:yes stop_codon:yes gene_type:complete